MIDKILEIGSTPDWMSPLLALIGDIISPDHERLYIDRDSATWSASQIERLLKKRGVKVWGISIEAEWIVLTVQSRQAEWAKYLLAQQGLTVFGQQRETSGNSQVSIRTRRPDRAKLKKNRRRR